VAPTGSILRTLLHLAEAVGRAGTVDDIYDAALTGLHDALGAERASILLFDPDGMMRFKAWRGISDAYRAAVEGHSPWAPDAPPAPPLLVRSAHADPTLATYLPVFEREGIEALAFIPLVASGRIVGKFMLYYGEPHDFSDDEVTIALTIASHIGFAVERLRTEAGIRRREERIRFALDAACMGTWEWDVRSNEVHWSDNLERIHGLQAGTFTGRFESYESEIHPDDRGRVRASLSHAMRTGAPHDVEYRIVAPDGTVRWVMGKGLVEFDAAGAPVRMSGVCMDITARKRTEIENTRLFEEAQRANRLKDEFLSTLSHEVRTPLTTILGWTSLLRSGSVPPARVPEALATIERNARAQARLIDEVLDVARVTSGKLSLTPEPMRPVQVLALELAAIRPALESKNVRLVEDLDRASAAIVQADPARLRQVAWNLLSNAAKFTAPGGEIRVCARVAQGRFELRVEDTGCGIAPEFLPHVFDRFRQADGSTTRAHGGLGLGLSITRDIVELHGGSIQVYSDGANRGACFVVQLPLAFTAVSAAPSAPEAAYVDQLLPGVRVLVVDDDADTRDLVKTLLEARGAQVACAASAPQVFSALEQSDVDVLLADIAMPFTDGYSLLRTLRSLDTRWRGLPAVALTACTRHEDEARALEAGFNAFCRKPIDAAALVSLIAATVASERSGIGT
jgi:PAS domain S-box-containing protein